VYLSGHFLLICPADINEVNSLQQAQVKKYKQASLKLKDNVYNIKPGKASEDNNNYIFMSCQERML
jgi:hypothetical protein